MAKGGAKKPARKLAEKRVGKPDRKPARRPPLGRICVFCGSSLGADPAFAEAARALGARLAARGIGLVYGGASIGVMAAVANGALEAGGEAHGVIPRMLLEKEVAHLGLTELHVVDTMHERKALMAELSDAFIALPGGIGTLEELFEVWTWTQLGAQDKPCGILNVEGFYDPLLAFIDTVIANGFLRAEHRELVSVATEPEALLALLEADPRRHVGDWIKPDEV